MAGRISDNSPHLWRRAKLRRLFVQTSILAEYNSERRLYETSRYDWLITIWTNIR